MGKGQSIAGLVLSIVGLVFGLVFSWTGWLPLIALPMAIVGLVLSVVGGKNLRANGQSTGLGTAGMVVGIIAVVISAITFFTCGLCTVCVASEAAALENALEDAMNSYY